MKKNLALLILMAVPALQSCYNKNILSREEVLTTVQNFDRGWRHKQAQVVDSVLSPSYIYFTQSGGTYSRENVIATAGSPDYKLDTADREAMEIQIQGNTAVVNTVWSAKGIYRGIPFNDSQRCSITIIKDQGKVQILSEHCTPIK